MRKNIKDTEIAKLRHNFSEYLKPQGKKSYDTTVSDSFYLYNNGHETEFFYLLQIKDVFEFQSLTYELLWKVLQETSDAQGKNVSSYIKSITLLWKYLHNDTSPYVTYKHHSDLSTERDSLQNVTNKQQNEFLLSANVKQMNDNKYVPRPSCAEVDKYLTLWNETPAYCEPDRVLQNLFRQTNPGNTSIDDIILKVSALNTIYGTYIYSIYPVAKHIQSLDIDERLRAGDDTLVNDLMKVFYSNGEKTEHFSFATKYCSFHNPDAFPIYDSFVDEVLWYYQRSEKFSCYKRSEIQSEHNYLIFKQVLEDFRRYFGLEKEKYTPKELDQYLWLFGKKHFPKK